MAPRGDSVKLADLENPVRAASLADQGFRLDPGPYVSEGYAARMLLQRLPRTELLERLTTRIFHAGRVKRQWTTSRSHGVPFLGSADIFQADLTNLQLIARSAVAQNPKLLLEAGWTLVTRSGMTAGRVAYARLSMQGKACSEDVLRVVADPDKVPPGYLYTFLAGPLGVPIIKGGIYGTSVRHIEPSHIADLPVPRLGEETELKIDDLIQEAMQLRQRFENGIRAATQDLFKSAGLPELLDFRWHDQSRDLDFSVKPTPTTIRALNHVPRAQRLFSTLTSVPYRTLGSICGGGQLSSGVRFKRVDSDPGYGARLIGQRQGFWLRPEGRWIDPEQAPAGIYATDETVLVAAQGTLGESEVYCRPIFVTGNWLEHVYTQHFLRVVSGDPEFPGAYLFAFLRSEAAFRMLRSMSVGGKQQDIHPDLRAELPVPVCTASDRERIAETVRQAYQDRDEADRKEDLAFALLEEAVREAAR
jgi:type I restriction enzyme S subunit